MNQRALRSVIHWCLERAFTLSKKIRNLQIHYTWYQTHSALHSDQLKAMLYMETMLDEYRHSLSCWIVIIKIALWLRHHFPMSKPLSITSDQTQILANRFLWVQAVAYESNLLSVRQKHNKLFIDLNTQKRSYEAIGWIPRSITRTLGRFRSELLKRSRLLVISEYRLLKYQIIASVEFFVFSSLFCCGSSTILRYLLLEPMILQIWAGNMNDFFLCFYQESEALNEINKFNNLIWLDGLMHQATVPVETNTLSDVNPVNLVFTQYTSLVTEMYLSLANNLWLGFCVWFICKIGHKRLKIVNSWLKECFYSLDDTMKAFSMILAKDLCIGFHSPHAWEIVIRSSLHSLGFPPNSYLLSLIISTLPVVIDSILKYWIFRHLNRISPAIVVTYHAMNE